MSEVTVGVDIGTTSVKALAADGDGTVVARARVRHPIGIPSADRFEHDLDRAQAVLATDRRGALILHGSDEVTQHSGVGIRTS